MTPSLAFKVFLPLEANFGDFWLQMVRTYRKKPGTRNYRNYTETQLEEAVQRIADGQLTMRAAVREYDIPFGTLNNKFHGKHIHNAGGQSALSIAEEVALINAAIKCSDWGFPLNLLDLRMLAKAYLDRCGRIVTKFKNNIPGKDWALSLLKRHKSEVAQRLASNINKCRSAVSRETLEIYFANLEQTLEGVNAANIFNYDETNVGDDPGKTRAIYRRGVKYPEKIVNHSKSNTTIMVCGSADGTLLPPYVIYKSEHLYNTWKEGGIQGKPCCTKFCCIKGCRFNRTSHGWMDANTFQDWFETCFMPHARRLEGQKILIGDNLASHINDSVIRLCGENNISFICLVPHSTHICQPLDVAFFKPMKVAWRAVLTDYKLRNRTSSGIPKELFPSLLSRALKKMDQVIAQTNDKPGDHHESAVKRNLINGFYATGIHPFNPNKVLNKIPGTSHLHDPRPIVDDALTELLRENRFGQNTQRVQRKRKRINVEPGRSVTTADSSSSDEGEETLDIPNDNECSENEDPPVEAEEVEYLQPEPELLVPGRFVLVNFIGGKRNSVTYKYVCKIQEQFSETEYTVVGLKSTNEGNTTFKLKPLDISTVPLSDICAVLPVPINNVENDVISFGKKVEVLEYSKRV
jgi:hypothetical protein